MNFKTKRTPKGFSKKASINGNTVSIVVARNKKGNKFSVIKINGKLAPTFATRIANAL